jgi:hypothetical protein
MYKKHIVRATTAVEIFDKVPSQENTKYHFYWRTPGTGSEKVHEYSSGCHTSKSNWESRFHLSFQNAKRMDGF